MATMDPEVDQGAMQDREMMLAICLSIRNEDESPSHVRLFTGQKSNIIIYLTHPFGRRQFHSLKGELSSPVG